MHKNYYIAETFEGENIHEFCGFRVTHKSSMKFGRAMPTYDKFRHSVKVFSMKRSLLTDP